MTFFISYPLSALGHDIWTRAYKGYDMKNDMLYDMFIVYLNRENNWFVPKYLVILGKN